MGLILRWGITIHVGGYHEYHGNTQITKDCVPQGTKHPHDTLDIYAHASYPSKVLSISDGTQDMSLGTHDIAPWYS